MSIGSGFVKRRNAGWRHATGKAAFMGKPFNAGRGNITGHRPEKIIGGEWRVLAREEQWASCNQQERDAQTPFHEILPGAA